MATTCDKKLVRSKSGLRIVPIKEDNQSPLIIAEPIWVPDSEVRLKTLLKLLLCIGQSPNNRPKVSRV